MYIYYSVACFAHRGSMPFQVKEGANLIFTYNRKENPEQRPKSELVWYLL